MFKDIFPRYRTMCGAFVERKGGWDCHGLPVELALEAELGFTSKDDIERFGIAEFNARCREKVLSHVEDWNRLTERIGFWIDLDDAYRTLDPDYVESVWWALKTIHDRGLLYEKLKVVPYCPRDQVTLSSHELGQPDVYRDVVDPSVYVRLPVIDPKPPLQANDELLIWTTTPWTLVSNAAVAVDPDLTYVRARTASGHAYVLAEARVEAVLGEDADVEDRFKGSQIEGARYQPPFDFIPGEAYGPKGHSVLSADFVTATDGTGLVHTAIAFGEDDFRLGEEQGLNVINPVRLDGTYDERIGPYAGRNVKDADPDLIEDLKSRGRLLKAETIEHSYPHCWRCGTPLLYYAKPSWYIATSQRKDRLLAANETVNWQPEHVKHGRFGNWLEHNVDWALSRERYWGTPLPVWRCQEGHTRAIGSLTELNDLAGTAVTDPHRPFVDDATFACPECGEPMHRVPEVIDVWFDSGSMPFAQYHAPHAGTHQFEEHFPADFICEALDQTRGWFYSLIAVNTLLFDQSPYRNVVCLGLILDENGRKMSKSLGNTIEPNRVIDRFGADALRWYFFTSKQPWDGYRFSMDAIAEALRQFLLQLWNTYGFYVLYANANGMDRDPIAAETTELDRWVLSRLQATIEVVRDRMDAFDATNAGRAIQAFIDEVSNWYVRRSRPRFWDGDPAAFATLRTCLITTAQLLAPFCPFVVDEIYDNLDGTEPSVHLTDFPAPDAAGRDEEPRGRDGHRPRDGPPRARRPRPGQDQGAPAAARSCRRGHGPRARGDRAVGGPRPRRAQRQGAALRVGGRRAQPGRAQAELPHARPPLREAHAVGGRRGRRPRRRPRGGHATKRRHGGDQRRRQGPRAHRRGRPDLDEAARGLPARKRGLPCRRARARDRRRATRRGVGARDRPRRTARPARGRARGHRPHLPHARWRSTPARRGA